MEYRGYAALKRELYRLKWSEEQLPKDMNPTTETLESIVEALDDIVYVSDIVTYEMYYLNPAGQRLTGVHDYKGQKCYKVIQGKDDPCEFCTNSCLRKDRFYIWEWDNKILKRHFILKDKLIPWRGKLARLEVAVDITNREFVSQAVREKLDFAENILACARALAEESDMEQATKRMLASVVDFTRQTVRTCSNRRLAHSSCGTIPMSGAGRVLSQSRESCRKYQHLSWNAGSICSKKMPRYLLPTWMICGRATRRSGRF